jgi:hypothetical protein
VGMTDKGYRVKQDMDGWDLFRNGFFYFRLRKSEGWVPATIDDLLLLLERIK